MAPCPEAEVTALAPQKSSSQSVGSPATEIQNKKHCDKSDINQDQHFRFQIFTDLAVNNEDKFKLQKLK